MFNVRNMDTVDVPLLFFTNRYDLERQIINPDFDVSGVPFIWETYQNWVNQTYHITPAPAVLDAYAVDYVIKFKFRSGDPDPVVDPGPFGYLTSPADPTLWTWDHAAQQLTITGNRAEVNDVMSSLYFVQDPLWNPDIVGGFFIDISVGDLNTRTVDYDQHELIILSTYDGNYSIARNDKGTKFSPLKRGNKKIIGNIKKRSQYVSSYRAVGRAKGSQPSRDVKKFGLNRAAHTFGLQSAITSIMAAFPDIMVVGRKLNQMVRSALRVSSLPWYHLSFADYAKGVEMTFGSETVWHTTGFNVIDNWPKVGKVGLVHSEGPFVDNRVFRAGGNMLADLFVRAYVLQNAQNSGRTSLDWSALTRPGRPIYPVTSTRLQTAITASLLLHPGVVDELKFERVDPARLYTILPLFFSGVSLTEYYRDKQLTSAMNTTTKFTPDHKLDVAFNSTAIAHKFPTLKSSKGERKLWFGYTALNPRTTIIRKPVGRKGISWSGKGAKVFDVPFYFVPVIEPEFGRYSGGITNVFAYKFTGRMSG